MANLKGSTFEKQIKDAFHRIEAFGESRHNNGDHFTHSDGVAQKRDMYLQDIKEYAENIGYQGKLNEMLTPDNMRDFFENRLDGLSDSTIQNYISGFSSMVEGLQEANVSIPVDRDFFQELKAEYKQDQSEDLTEPTIKGVDNPVDVINALYEKDYFTGLVADISYSMGFRASEAIEIASHPELYIGEDGKLSGVIGKGGQEYPEKELPEHIIAALGEEYEITSYSSINRNLEEYDITMHDFRYQYAHDKVEEYLEDGMSYKDALLEVSEEMNHHREDITKYYLSKTK